MSHDHHAHHEHHGVVEAATTMSSVHEDQSGHNHGAENMTATSVNHALHHMMSMAVKTWSEHLQLNKILTWFFCSSTAAATRKFYSNNGRSKPARVSSGRCLSSLSWEFCTKVSSTIARIYSGNRTMLCNIVRCQHLRRTRHPRMEMRVLCSKCSRIRPDLFWLKHVAFIPAKFIFLSLLKTKLISKRKHGGRSRTPESVSSFLSMSFAQPI